MSKTFPAINYDKGGKLMALTRVRKLWIAGLFAPLVAPIVVSLVLLVPWGRGEIFPDGWRQGVALVFYYFTPVSYAATWLAGLPAIFGLRAIDALSRRNAFVVAAVVGAISGSSFIRWLSSEPLSFQGWALSALSGLVIAMPVAMCFCWAAAIPRRAVVEGEVDQTA
jgi:hypothetical protein